MVFRLNARRVMPGVRNRLIAAARDSECFVPPLGGGLTTACTRPAKRQLSCASKGFSGRVMPGVRNRLNVAARSRQEESAGARAATERRSNKRLHRTRDTQPVMFL